MSTRLALLTVVAFGVAGAEGRAEACKYNGSPAYSGWHLDVNPGHRIGPHGLIQVAVVPGGPAEDVGTAMLQLHGRDVYLEDERGVRVGVDAQDTRADGSSVLLRPRTPLREDGVYHLTVGTSTSTWQVDPDATAPRWTGRAREIDRGFNPTIRHHRPCEIARQLTLSLPLAGDAPPIVSIRATSLQSGAVLTWFTTPYRKGSVELGEALVDGETYAIELSAIDLAGGEAPMPGGPLIVRAPSPGDPWPSDIREFMPPVGVKPAQPLDSALDSQHYGLFLLGLGLLILVILLLRGPPVDS